MTTDARREYMRQYYQRPEVKERFKESQRRFRERLKQDPVLLQAYKRRQARYYRKRYLEDDAYRERLLERSRKRYHEKKLQKEQYKLINNSQAAT